MTRLKAGIKRLNVASASPDVIREGRKLQQELQIRRHRRRNGPSIISQHADSVHLGAIAEIENMDVTGPEDDLVIAPEDDMGESTNALDDVEPVPNETDGDDICESDYDGDHDEFRYDMHTRLPSFMTFKDGVEQRKKLRRQQHAAKRKKMETEFEDRRMQLLELMVSSYFGPDDVTMHTCCDCANSGTQYGMETAIPCKTMPHLEFFNTWCS